MKKLVLFFSLAACVAVSSNAQSTSTPTEKAPKTATPKEKTGAVSVKPTAETAPVAMKDHVCTVACKDGAHVYAHGEKGHTCGEACKKMKSAKSTKMAPKKTSSSSTTTTPPPVGAPTTTSDDTKPAAGETKSLKMKK
ncbi:MAG: hypothetical protein IPK91_12245 [Saprospiraceae bacterium]|nr:hypothetical protein [Saprospiraceae bacterium]MBK8298023.1 hypothetical protein [Saprospiraceae bacterium]